MSDLWIPKRLPTKFMSRTHVDRRDRLRWKNEADEIVPPFGVVQISSYDGGNQEFVIQKPDGGVAVFPNGPVRVQTTKRGGSPAWNVPRPVLLDSTSYSCGDEVGPVAGEWHMSNEGSGFYILKEPDASSIAIVDRVGGGSMFAHAEVVACLGGGYYQLRIAAGHMWDVPEEYDSLSGEGCDLCDEVTGCGEATEPEREVMTGDGSFVFGYDPRKIPLDIPGHAFLVKTSATVPDEVYPDDYTPYGESSTLWMVLTGSYPMVSIPDRFYECCDDGSIKLTRCDNYLVEGVLCVGAEDPCPGAY